jgi:hypothetical protein
MCETATALVLERDAASDERDRCGRLADTIADAVDDHEQSTAFLALLLVHLDGRRGTRDGPIDLTREHRFEAMTDTQHSSESVMRLDADCLAVLCPEVSSPMAAISRCEELLAVVRSDGGATSTNTTTMTTASIGLSLLPSDRRGAVAFVADAAKALRRATSEGGDRWATT